MKELLKNLPKMDLLLEHNIVLDMLNKYSYNDVKKMLKESIDTIRNDIINDTFEENNDLTTIIINNARKQLIKKYSYNIKKVINATGVILHTNLGRARIQKEALKHAFEIASSYCNLEYNIYKGMRGDRHSHIQKLITDITGAEDAVIVNNNAAAVLLALDTFTSNKEAIVSRGELVEIGGSFRIPDVMKRSNAKLVEVGTTNKTHISDYENAITEETGAIVKVHTSNYKILGFTKETSNEEISNLGKKYNIITIEDLGSGTFVDFSNYGICKEPTILDSVHSGIDIITFSGDKLLGGPQCGIIIGKKEYINKIKNNQLLRALRVDKITLSILEYVLMNYRDMNSAVTKIPTLKSITMSIDEQLNIIERFIEKVDDKSCIKVSDSKAQIGGGSLPTEYIDSKVIIYSNDSMKANEIEETLRSMPTSVIGRIENNNYMLDLRTLSYEELDILASYINDINRSN